MNEKRIQQVLEIEKQAQAIYEAAVNEARDVPAKAEQEAQIIVENARAEAEQDARQMIDQAQSEEESRRILAETEDNIRRNDAIAKSNFERALQFVLYRVVGKE